MLNYYYHHVHNQLGCQVNVVSESERKRESSGREIITAEPVVSIDVNNGKNNKTSDPRSPLYFRMNEPSK